MPEEDYVSKATCTLLTCLQLILQLPLYPPTTIYLQLMSETRSRINACPAGVGTGVSGESTNPAGNLMRHYSSDVVFQSLSLPCSVRQPCGNGSSHWSPRAASTKRSSARTCRYLSIGRLFSLCSRHAWERYKLSISEQLMLLRGTASLQWVALRRPHAEAVTTDEKVFDAFVKHCRSWFDQAGCALHQVFRHSYQSPLLARHEPP